MLHALGCFMEVVCKPVCLVLLPSWLAGLLMLFVFGKWRYCRVYRTKWYDLSEKGPNKEMKWQQIQQLMTWDPMEDLEQLKKRAPEEIKLRRFPRQQLLIDLASLIFIVIAIVLISSFIRNFQLWLSHPKVVPVSGMLAFLASVITISFQIRLKARAENRQAWIKSIRAEISALVSNFPPPWASKRMIDSAFQKAQPHFAELELYLNPSERIHRALMAVLRFMYSYEPVDVDREVREKLGIPTLRCPWKYKNTGYARWQWLKWRSVAIRLANVLLKREWEQVKYIK